MRIAIVTDAWTPQVNGVVTTLIDLRQRLRARGHEVVVVEPSEFARVRCPGYPEIELAWRAGAAVQRRLAAHLPDAIHIATEGPLGFAARSYCRRADLPFTTAFHSRFPEFLTAALGIPACWGYAVMRRFHAPSSGVMVPSAGTLRILRTRGFVNLRRWSHGIDLELFQPRSTVSLGWPRPVFLSPAGSRPRRTSRRSCASNCPARRSCAAAALALSAIGTRIPTCIGPGPCRVTSSSTTTAQQIRSSIRAAPTPLAW